MSAKNSPKKYQVKKCPECFTALSIDADRCTSCNQRVGAVNDIGIAELPVDWMSYFNALLAASAFCFFIWWVFLK